MCVFVYIVRKLNNDSKVYIFMYPDAIFISICLKIPFTFQNTEYDHLPFV